MTVSGQRLGAENVAATLEPTGPGDAAPVSLGRWVPCDVCTVITPQPVVLAVFATGALIQGCGYCADLLGKAPRDERWGVAA